MRFCKLFGLIASVGILFSTVAVAGQPDWVNGNSAEYPDEQYLVGRGVGSTEAEAQDRARGDLATIFEVRVHVSNESNTTVTKTGNQEQVDKSATQQVSAKTDKVISGIKIVQIWRDPAMDFHAFAVLSRSQAKASLREEMGKIDDAVQLQIQAAQANQDPLQKVGALSQALQSSIKREGFQALLKVVDPTGRGIDAPVSQATIQLQISDILKHIKISPEVAEDDGAKEFFGILKGGLAAAGFLPTGKQTADLLLVGKLSMTDLGRRDNWNWVRGTVEISLVEKASGRVRGSQTWPFKASAQDPKTARSRLLLQVEKQLKDELRSAIIEFAAS